MEAVLKKYNARALNMYTDSQYIYRAMLQMETVPFIGTQNSEVQTLFRCIQQVTRGWQQPCFFGHLLAHTGLLGPLALGNVLPILLCGKLWLLKHSLLSIRISYITRIVNSLRKQFCIT